MERGNRMTENELKQYPYLIKEIQVLSKELINVKSDYLIKKQDFIEKLYVGRVIEKTAKELEKEIASIEESISLKLKELMHKRIEIEQYINSIEDCEIRLILRLRHIDCMSFNDMASMLTVVDDSGKVLRSISGDGLSAKMIRFFKNMQ